MKWLLLGIGLLAAHVSSFQSKLLAEERSALARVTVYWHDNASGANAAWNGLRLHEGHCAVDPKKIPYGSKVLFDNREFVAVDSGPAVVSRMAARSSGRDEAERNAIVIDRFFENKQDALTWAKSNPHFMVVRVRTPGI